MFDKYAISGCKCLFDKCFLSGYTCILSRYRCVINVL